MAAMKEEKRSVTKNRDRIVERAKEFYEKFYFSDINNNSVIKDGEFNEPSTTYTVIPVPEISPDELEHTIHQLKQEKAPGPDNIIPDMLKDARPPILEPLANLFTECLK